MSNGDVRHLNKIACCKLHKIDFCHILPLLTELKVFSQHPLMDIFQQKCIDINDKTVKEIC